MDVGVARERYEVLLQVSTSKIALGTAEEARRALQEALEQVRKVAASNPNDAGVQFELANGEARLGLMLLDGRNAAAALTYVQDSAAILGKLRS